ncbi:homoserine kinase [Mariniluteicoccus endophyticus]
MGEGALQPGRIARVRVPATSANLGPGFDHLGLGLAWYDECEVEVLADGVQIEVTGEGAGSVPRDRSHLLVQCLDRGLADLGLEAPGVRLRAHNTIPHSRGLGSSSAATVAGLAAAWALSHPGEPLDREWTLRLANQIEGHADNVAPAIHGGFAITYVRGDEGERGIRSAAGRVHPDIAAVALVPQRHVPTRSARAVLPDDVPRRDAVAGSGRAALLVHAMAVDPAALLDATRDWLHQPYRANLMPESTALIARLRSQGHGAFVSGAGPTVLVLGRRDHLAGLDEVEGFTLRRLEIGHGAELF